MHETNKKADVQKRTKEKGGVNVLRIKRDSLFHAKKGTGV